VGYSKEEIRQIKNYAHIFSLKQKITQINIRQQKQLGACNRVVIEIGRASNLPPTDNKPNLSKKRIEQDLIFTYLAALDSSYETAVGFWSNQIPLRLKLRKDCKIKNNSIYVRD
jgi:hypothetical protein